jgi:hypothetical protein
MTAPTTITIELDLGALPPEGVEGFLGGACTIGKDGRQWSGFVTDAQREEDAIRLTVQALETDAWNPE